MQRPRRTRSRGCARGDEHSEISSKFSLACVMSAALSTALADDAQLFCEAPKGEAEEPKQRKRE